MPLSSQTTPGSIESVQAQIDADPELQRLLAGIRQGAGGGLHGNQQMAHMGQRVSSVLAAHGIQLPHDYVLSVNDGQLQRHDFWERNPWVAPAIVIGAGGAMALAAAPGLLASTATTPTAATGGATAASTAAVPAATAATEAGVLPVLESTVVPQAMSTLPAAGASVLGPSTAAAPSLLGRLGNYGEIASDVSQSLQQGRRQDDYASMQAAALNNRALVDAAQFNLNVPLTRAQQTARGDLMSSPTLQDSTVTGSGRNVNISGGVRPSSFGADTSKAGEELKRQALLKLMDPASDQLTPQLTTPRKPGAAETGAGIVGTGLGILGAYNAYRGR